ncbi:MAG: hypothetical protein HY721_16315 [Planctomycetes bacterium]|nr:hypothetical protein [Planctomycetota bacterium]
MSVAAAHLSFIEFVHSGLLLGDHGQPIAMTPLLSRFADVVEGGARVIVLCTPRRCGKSTCLSVLAAWFLLTRPMSFATYVCSTSDQAADVLGQKLGTPLRLFGAAVKLGLGVARDRLTRPRFGSTVAVLPAVEVSAVGRSLDCLILDECRGIAEEVVEILRPSAMRGLIVMAGTPGAPRGWWHRAVTQPEPGARVIILNDPAEAGNPELDLGFVARERERLKARGAYGELLAAREWGAAWVDAVETPFLKPSDIGRSSVEEVEAFDRSAGDVAFAAADLSVTRDLTSTVVVARRGESYRVVHVDVLDPRRYGGTLPLEIVEERLEKVWRDYQPRRFVVDQYQAVSIAQRLRGRGVRVEPVAVTAGLNILAFETLAELLAQGRLRWRRHERLEAELANLEVEETRGGNFRITDNNARLHRDVAWSLAVACHEAVRSPGPCRIWGGALWDDLPAAGPAGPRPKAEIKADVRLALLRDY